MSWKSYQKVSFLFIVLVVVIVAFITPYASAQVGAEEVEPLDSAIEQIEAAGEYSFIAQIEQTLIPRPIPINVGTSEQRIDSQMSGKVILPDYAQIDLQFESGTEFPSISIEQDGSAVYLLKDGERTQIENPLSVSPTADFLGYKKAAEHLRVIKNDDQPQLTIYAFEISGEKFGDHLIEMMRDQLPAGQQGAQLQVPASIFNMSGQGELWVDADGYPQRQVLDIHIPEANDQFDAQSRIIIDYDFKTELSGVALPTADQLQGIEPAAGESGLLGAGVSQPPTDSSDLFGSLTYILLSLLFFSLVVLLIGAVFYYYSYRWLRIVVPIGLALILVATPILHPLSYVYAAAKNASAELPSLGEALGFGEADGHAESDGISAADAGAEPTEALLAASQAQLVTNNQITCGTGNTITDTDFDGTSDFVENCLGTNAFNFDTDLDGITDTLEINGIVFTDTLNVVHTIYSNPHEIDSNRDGLDDLSEWPAPIGFAPSADPDGDNIHNLWDDDNDGDGIVDKLDIDPFSKSEYRSDFAIRTGLNGSSFNGVQYIEFQVQPQDQSRFQLLTTELDWPYDDQGTLQARDVSRSDELTFTPMLKIEANTLPDVFRRGYGVSIIQQGGTEYVYVDLSPVTDAGRITGFYGKVAYSQSQLADINWSKVEMVWTVLMKNSPLNEADNSKFTTIPVAEYVEPSFRFAGLEVTKSADTKYAVIGTPNSQTDHRQLVNLVAGLEGSFLSNQPSNFDTIIGRLTSPASTLTETWGVPVSNIAVGVPFDQPKHLDMVFRTPWDTLSTLTTFLTNNSYSTAQTASLIMAMESSTGTDGLDGDVSIDGKTFTFNLADIPVYTTRTVSLSHYQHNGTRWDDVDDLSALNNLVANYPGNPAAAVTTLQQSYPQINEADLAIMLLAFYTLWQEGRTAVIDVDGVSLVAEAADAQALYQRIGLTTINDTLVYLTEAYKLGDPGGSVVYNDPVKFRDYSNTAVGPNKESFIILGLVSLEFAVNLLDDLEEIIGFGQNVFRLVRATPD
ncbi:MAG: hypothetical protein AAF633_21725, partial [Chloroflexota bacterium]